MKLIVGLGNPGEKYEQTRHNVGFVALDHLLEDYTTLKRTFWEKESDTKSLIKRLTIEGEDVLLAKPQTFMNNSGEAVGRLMAKYKIATEDVYIIYDDLDLPLGKLRIRFGGAAGGHKGVESILAHVKSDKFLRIRLGIGRPIRMEDRRQKQKINHSVEDYVIAPFTSSEKSKVRTMINQTTKSLCLILAHGIKLYMSKYNGVDAKKKKKKRKRKFRFFLPLYFWLEFLC